MERLGPHAATRAGLDLDREDGGDLGAWLVLCVLLGGRAREDVALAAFRRLASEGLATPGAIAAAGPAAVHPLLEADRVPKSEVVAAVLARVCSTLEKRHEGSIDRLARDAEGLEQLAQRLAALGAGFGRSAVLRFLTPLRPRWSAAHDLPGTAAATSAAAHLGRVVDAADVEALPASVARWLRDESENGEVDESNAASTATVRPRDTTPRDLEAALERLGRAACLRGKSDRCPLANDCPARGRGAASGREWGDPE